MQACTGHTQVSSPHLSSLPEAGLELMLQSLHLIPEMLHLIGVEEACIDTQYGVYNIVQDYKCKGIFQEAVSLSIILV